MDFELKLWILQRLNKASTYIPQQKAMFFVHSDISQLAAPDFGRIQNEFIESDNAFSGSCFKA
jgi:hypothetical protein